MTLHAIDPNTALIVVDLQKGVVAHPCAHPVADIVRNAAALAFAFRRQNRPVVLVNVAGTAPGRTERALTSGARSADWSDLVPELAPQASDQLVTKRTWDAFCRTGLEDHLKTLGVTQVVVAGIATSIGVESTARSAYELGFNVTLATDAMTDRSAEAHANSTGHVFPRLGETGTTAEIIQLMATRAA